jgi:ligand-binding SRPBCC domain-containing protein
MGGRVRHQPVTVGTQIFIKRTRIPAPAAVVFQFHEQPGALEKLTPPWAHAQVIEQSGGIRDGGRVVLRIQLGPIPVQWIAEHRSYIAGREFQDVQVKGPFALWIHNHRVEPDGPEACFLEDRVEYALPFGWLGHLFGGALVLRRIERLFQFRHRVTLRETLQHGENHS